VNTVKRSARMIGVLCTLVLAAQIARGAATPQTAKPEWMGSKAGISDEVLPPWTPVTVSGNTVNVWGRSYRFSGLPMPDSVVARESEMLASPVTLSGTVDGKPLAWARPTCRTADARPSVARLATSIDSDSLGCEGTVATEYDGMIRVDFKLVPKRKLTLEKLVLEVPLRAAHAKYLHFWPGKWGSVYNSEALPQEGFRGPFKPFYWLGDESRGFCWFAESDQGFFNAQKDRVVEIRREGDVVRLCINIVTVPQTVEQPLAYTFGFQATPVKPDKPNAWDYRICHMGRYGIESQKTRTPEGKEMVFLDYVAQCGVRNMCFHEHWTDIQNYPKTTHGKELHKLVEGCHQRKIQLLLYHGYELSNIAPEWNEYQEQCLVFPRAGGYKRKPEQIAYIGCYRSPWQDFIADGVDKLMREYKIDGVYLDGTSEPWGCRNTRHGCGYKRPDGAVGETYPIFATRAMMKRLYTIVKSHNPNGQVNVHQSTCMTIPTLAFATSYWDGEQLQSLKRKQAAQNVLPFDAFRCEFMGHNWGVPAELLWYASGPFTRNEALSMALLHDVPMRPASLADLALSAKLWKARDAFGASEATWVPYWQSEAFVTTGSPTVKVSLHNRPGKGLIAVLANTTKDDATVPVSFKLPSLKQPTELKVIDVVNDKELTVAAGRLEIPVKAGDFAVIWLQPK